MMLTPKSSLLLVILMFIICIVIEASEGGVQKRSTFRRFRQRPRQMRYRLETLRRNPLANLDNIDNSSEWVRSLIPDMPSAEDIDCNIEVEVVERIGGRCVRLGGSMRMAVCQSGMYLDVHSEECQYIIAAREVNERRQQREQAQTETETGVTEQENTAQQTVGAA